MMADDPLKPTELAVAVPMLLGERFPDATVGLRQSPKGLTRLVYRGGDGSALLVLIPYRWPFAGADNPDEPIDDLVLVNAASLRSAIVDGSKTDGMLNIEPLGPPAADVEDPEHYDFRAVMGTEGTQVARLARRSLDRFRQRVKATAPPVLITGSFAVNGDAAEFVKLGIFNADTELIVTVHSTPETDEAPRVTRIGLVGENAAVIW